MTERWAWVLIACGIAYATKMAGYLVPDSVLDRPWVATVSTGMTVGLLTSLVVANTFVTGTAVVMDARVAALVAAAISFIVTLEGPVWERVLPVVDAVALGAWAAAGALKTLSFGMGWLPALLLGVLTACGGGALRDIVVRRTPTVLGGNTLYATCALIAAGVMVLAFDAGQSHLGLLAAALTGATLCLLARWRGWMLPDRDSWSPRQIVPRRARSALCAQRDAIRRRRTRPTSTD